MIDSVAPIAFALPEKTHYNSERENNIQEFCSLGTTQASMKALTPSQVKKIILISPEILTALHLSLKELLSIFDTCSDRLPKKEHLNEMEEPAALDYAA